MASLGFDRYEAEFAAETDRLATVVSEVDPDLVLPTCPEWTVRELVTHVGTGHRWATAIIEGRLSAPPPRVAMDAPEQVGDWADWLRAGANGLSLAIRAAGPDATVWTWRPEKTAEFWLRKMLHDEVVHRFDVELANGRRGEVPVDLAADGISDLLDTCSTLSRPDLGYPIFASLAGTGETLHLHATDPGLGEAGEWLAERGPTRVTWRHGHARADVAVRAPARELLLLLNRRLSSDEDGVEVIGDDALLAYWLENSQF